MRPKGTYILASSITTHAADAARAPVMIEESLPQLAEKYKSITMESFR
jgi:hypothetical protein